MGNKATLDSINQFRVDLKHKIENALIILKWDRMKLAEEYGIHLKEKSYSRARMTQLVNVHAGHEVCSKKMHDWLSDRIGDKVNESR